MIYYNGRNLSPYIALFFLFLGMGLLGVKYFKPEWIYPVPKEIIIGYEIDEMRTPAGKTVYDTVGIIFKKGDSLFIKDAGAYDRKPLK